ncbi:MAG: sensor histidine kinase [Vulcanimicrobiota bacterium]
MPPGPTSQLKVASILVATVTLLVALAASSQPSSWWIALSLLFLAVICELMSVGLRHCGRVSFIFSCCLVAAQSPSVGPGWAGLMTLLALSSRLAPSHIDLGTRALELATEGLPIALALWAGLLVDPASQALKASVVVYLGALWWLVPWLLPVESNYRAARSTSFPLVALTVLASACLAGRDDSLVWFGLIPVLASLSCVGLMESYRDQERASLFLERHSRANQQLQTDLHLVQGELEERLAERSLLEELAHTFAATPDLEHTVRASLEVFRRLVEVDSLVLFFPREGRLLPARWLSNSAERLESAELLDLAEPVVERAWQQQKLVLTSRQDLDRPRLLEAERMAVALPLKQLGVLYLGKSDPSPFERRQLYLIALVAEPMIPALESGLRQQELKVMMAKLARQKDELARVSYYQRLMLGGFTDMAGQPGSAQLVTRFQRLLAELCPHHQAGRLELADGTVHGWPQSAPMREPVEMEGPGLSHFPSSQLYAPLTVEGRPAGKIWLFHSEAEAFSPADLAMVQTAGYFATAQLHIAELLDRLTQANQALKESQAQLVQSSKMAAVGQLAAGIAHELNSPLAAVKLALGLISERIDQDRPEKAQSQVKMAEEAVDTAREIISNLLVYSRPSAPTMAPVNPHQVVERTLRIVEAPLRKRGLELGCQLEPVPQIRGRESDLRQVLTNLLLNACDAAAEQTRPQVQVAVRAQGDRVLFEVSDNGPGVADEVADRLFEPFFTTKAVGAGTGLGLSVAYQIVKEHQGKLSFHRENGLTVFRVDVPRL